MACDHPVYGCHTHAFYENLQRNARVMLMQASIRSFERLSIMLTVFLPQTTVMTGLTSAVYVHPRPLGYIPNFFL